MLGIARLTGISQYYSSNADPYADNVVLLLHADGTSGGQTFTDDSGYNRTATRYGSVVNNTSVKKFGTASLQYDTTLANGDRLLFPASADFNLNITNWTWEFWAYATNAANGSLANRRTTTGAVGWVLTRSGLRAKINGTWSDTQISFTAPSSDVWHHYAFVKNGTVITVYVDGVSVGSKTGVTSMEDLAATGVSIGNGTGYASNENEWAGYLDEIRFTKNIARYTSNFTVPSEAFPSIPLRPRSARTITASGNAKLSTAQFQFGTAAYIGDGSGDYVTVANDDNLSSWNTGSAYTIEYWIRPSSMTAFTDAAGAPNGAGNKSATTGTNYWSFGPLNDGRVCFYYYKGTTTFVYTTGITLTANNWYHLAMVRNGTNIQIYVNGTSYATATVSGTPQISSATAFTIGQSNNVSVNGYIDELRVSRVARYTANFTTPAAAFTFDANTELLMHCDGTNNSTTFIDSIA